MSKIYPNKVILETLKVFYSFNLYAPITAWGYLRVSPPMQGASTRVGLTGA